MGPKRNIIEERDEENFDIKKEMAKQATKQNKNEDSFENALPSQFVTISRKKNKLNKNASQK